MSSTSRGYERHKTDYYITPISTVEDFLQSFVAKDSVVNPKSLKWLDPCAGGDKDNSPSYVQAINNLFTPDHLQSVDIREDSKAEIVDNFLTMDTSRLTTPDIIISNPPFVHAKEFIEKSLEIVNGGGYVVMLLRLNFFGSKARKSFFDNHMPVSCYIHHRRMSFFPKDFTIDGKLYKAGTTDSIEYAHFVWKRGEHPDFTKTYLI